MKSTIVSTDDFKMSGLCEGCDNQITAIAQAAKFQIFIERVLHSSYFFIFICGTKYFFLFNKIRDVYASIYYLGLFRNNKLYADELN